MTHPAPPQDNRRAILVMCVGVLLLVINDAIAKLLVATFGPFQILLLRSALALPMIAAVILWRDGPGGLRSTCLRVHAVRAALAVGATWLFIRSFADLPLAEATALIFTAPIFVALLSAPLLGQHVGPLRAAAIGLGFLGALIAIRPGAETMQPAALLALAAALVNALVMLSARLIDPRDGFWTMTFWMTLFSGLFCAATLALDWSPPGPAAIALLAAMAVTGTLAIALITHAFRIGHAAAVAPFDYTALLWAALIGWVVWGTVPGWPVWLGAGIIAAGGLGLILLDARAKRTAD
ncbi:MAG: DMT family transporter [Roseovarius sp.]|uniref:DMT family transporter n=1 Tax=Roseovarius sp. TaxID=1486281 RepID=UPI0032EE45A3